MLWSTSSLAAVQPLTSATFFVWVEAQWPIARKQVDAVEHLLLGSIAALNISHFLCVGLEAQWLIASKQVDAVEHLLLGSNAALDISHFLCVGLEAQCPVANKQIDKQSNVVN